MTEAEWLACENSIELLRYLTNRTQHNELTITERKWRLMACGFCRRIWHLLPDDFSRATVELCECYVDGLADPQLLWAAFQFGAVEGGCNDGTLNEMAARAAIYVGCQGYEVASGYFPYSAEESVPLIVSGLALDAQELAGAPRHEGERGQCEIVRDVAGGPFRAVTFSPKWLTDTVRALASQMYESRDFGAMPILADALQDAGCDSTDILGHCRGEGPHVRGCWVCDLVLGKA